MRSVILNALMSVLTCTILLPLIFNAVKNPSPNEQKCKGLRTHGRWLQPYDTSNKNLHWQPYGCKLHQYDEATTSKCLTGRTLYFAGDSTIRQVFWATAYKLGGAEAQKESKNSPKHADLLYRRNDASLQYRWDPFLNKSETLGLIHNLNYQDSPYAQTSRQDSLWNNSAGVLLSSGLWHARYSGSDFAAEYKSVMEMVTSKISTSNKTQPAGHAVIVVPSPALNYDWLSPERAASLTETRTTQLLQTLEAAEQCSSLEVVWSAREMTENNPVALMNNGLHVTPELATHQADLLLNRLCNDKLFQGTNQASSMCCVGNENRRFAMSILISIAMVSYVAVFFWKRIDHEQQPKGTWVQVLVVLFVVVCYCWVADRTILFPKSDKIVSNRIFELCALMAMAVGMMRITAIQSSHHSILPHPSVNRRLFHSDPGFLSRIQTEEWKGWMQILILLYHYFGMSKTLWVYQMVRVLVAAYLFLTGFGHATYFQKSKDFSATRIIAVLLRLNFIPCILSLVMNNEYDFYYFPGLASLWFLVTFAVFWRRNGGEMSTNVSVLRVVVAISIMHVVLSSETLVNTFFDVLCTLRGPRFSTKEFIFRVGLDMYSPFFGMLVAIAQQRELDWPWSRREFNASFTAMNSLHRPVTLTVSCAFIVIYILLVRQFADKFSYNRYHSVLSLLPITAYLMARNANQAARRYASPVFASIGRYSLELFVLQYHIWLAADTKGLLRLGLIDRAGHTTARSAMVSWKFWVETLIVTVIFFWFSKQCADATNTLVAWVTKKDKECCEKEVQVLSGGSISRKTYITSTFGCRCQRRQVVVVSVMIVGLWLSNVIKS